MDVNKLSVEEKLKARYEKFRKMGDVDVMKTIRSTMF